MPKAWRFPNRGLVLLLGSLDSISNIEANAQWLQLSVHMIVTRRAQILVYKKRGA